MSEINFRVDEILKEKGWSLTLFAEKAGINYHTALDISKNNYRRIGLDTLAKICDALEVSPGDILVHKKP